MSARHLPLPKHTPLLPPLLKQHREQGLWIINTPKFPHDSGQRCPSSKRCWCVEEESHGRSPDEYKIHVQTQCRNWTGGLRGSELGRQSKRASGLKLQTSCVHTDNWHACRRCCNCKISKKKKKRLRIFFWGNLERNCMMGIFLTKRNNVKRVKVVALREWIEQNLAYIWATWCMFSAIFHPKKLNESTLPFSQSILRIFRTLKVKVWSMQYSRQKVYSKLVLHEEHKVAPYFTFLQGCKRGGWGFTDEQGPL